METSEKYNRLEKLEAIRGFSALYVMLFHVLPQKIHLFGINVGFLFRFGSEAVILFFVLSGFVIKYSWEKSEDKSFLNYFGRRFLRIYIPLFFIFLIGYLLKCYATGSLADPEWSTLLGNIFMLQDVISLKPNVIVPTYMGNGLLWSLSYEWWFYMLFFALTKYIRPEKISFWVSSSILIAAVLYVVYPFILNRIVMYFGIWWIGVELASIYIKGGSFSFKVLSSYIGVLAVVIVVLVLNVYLHFSYTKGYSYPLVAYPIVELRHFVFALLVLLTALIWNAYDWFGFITFFGVFKYFAPFSYVIYISHHYLVVEATYLKFINDKIVEYSLYILVMFLFSYVIEVLVYTKIKNQLIGYFSVQSIKKVAV